MINDLATTVTLLGVICLAGATFPDWLVDTIEWTSDVERKGDTLVLTNGLISRTFLLTPGLVTTDFYSHEKRSSLLRALAPEVRMATLHICYTSTALYKYYICVFDTKVRL